MKHRAGIVGLLGLIAALTAADAFSSPQTPGRARAYYLYSLAQQAQFERNYVDALKYLQEAVRSDDTADLHVELAEFYSSLNQADQAEQEARRAVSLEPKSVEARRALAQILTTRAPEGEAGKGALDEPEKIYQDLLNQGNADETIALALADIQADRGDAAAAAATLKAFRSSQPFSSAVDLQLARLDLQTGAQEEALALLQGIVEREKDNRDARDLLGSTLEDDGRFEEAAAIYGPLVEQSPNNPYLQYRLGGVLLSLKRYPEARSHLLTALQADPRNLRVLLALGQAYEGTRETNLAESAYQNALERDGSSLEAKFFLARLQQGRGRDEQALGLYGQILASTASKSSSRERAFFGLASSQVGMLRYFQKDYPAAIASLKEAFQAADHPTDDLFALLTRTYLAANQMDEALRTVSAGLTAIPESLELKALEGEILLRQGLRDKARQRFRELVEQGKGDEETYLEIVQACQRAEKYPEAESWVKEAMSRRPGSRELEFQAAAVQDRLGRFKEAEKRFRELIRQDPQNAEALNYLGYMLADRGVKLGDALGFLQKAVGMDPENIAYQDSLGWVYYRLGRLEQAEALLVKAAQGSRNDPTIYDHLGDTLAGTGKAAAARKAYETALAHDPENPDEIRKKIRRLGPAADGP